MNAKHKMLFFRDQADEANVDGIDDQLCIPASRFVSMSPASATTLDILFRSVKNNDLSNNSQLTYDKVTLTVTQGDIQEVMDSLISYFNSGNNSDGFVVIADDCTTTDSATTALDDLTIGAVYAHPSISGVDSITVADKLYRTDLPAIGTGNVAPTATAAGALAVNTHYTNDDTASTAYTIASAADSRAGDWITVTYTVSVGNTNTHTYTTADTNWTPGSLIRNQGGSRVGKVDVSTTNDDRVLITGASDGDGGVGSVIRFVNMTGKADGWAVDAELVSQGDGTTAAAAFTATGFVAV